MPFATHKGTRLYWRLQGLQGAPVIVLLHGIGADQTLFDAIVPFLIDEYRLLRVDFRGHGASDATAGDYSLDLLVGDVLAVMDAAGVDKATLCGVSLGGMVGMEAGLKAPDRFTGLILACTSPSLTDFWRGRVAAVREAGGMSGIAAAATGAVLSKDYAAAHPGFVDGARYALSHMSLDGYAGCGAAIRDMDVLDRLPGLDLPVLVLAGEQDLATPFTGHGDRIVAAIPGAQSLIMQTGHWACVEAPDQFAQAVREFAG
ncbi:alpha/beta fold hydrolase [Sphingobium tyrosinilyticum]|uniref:Alpha/beta fold hydrolase n=1 Tax=Sphingobium tyrosinilyticum TaxID=2715436 RepID=A0ABV9F460_9SPHN